MKKFLIGIIIFTFCVSLSMADESSTKSNLTSPLINHRVDGGDPLPDMPVIPYTPNVLTDSPGEIVGTTQYDYQTNGSTGRRIAVDSQGGVHFAWMNAPSYPSSREVSYNYVSPDNNWLGATTVSQSNGAGYCNLALTNDDRAVVIYHQWQVDPHAVIAIDAFTGFGIFDFYDPPDMLDFRGYWPYGAVDGQDYIHIVVIENSANAGDPQTLGYTRSEDGGSTWTLIEAVDTLTVISQSVAASPVSNKVAIMYTHPTDITSQWYNDIYYVESDDGVTWDFRFDKVNITNYGSPDSLFAYTDLSGVYDYNDDLNIVWNAQWISEDGAIYYRTYLYHYNTGTETISEIDYHPDTSWAAGCDFGAWNRPISKMSIATIIDTWALLITYTKFDDQDCSLGGYANGDIYYQFGTDHGTLWGPPVNMTDSQTPGCAAGDCDSDHWSTIAEIADNQNLHLIFIEDKDAGGIAQTEGVATVNPVKYLSYPFEPVGIENDEFIPVSFNLDQNYPNPFNAITKISFNLEFESDVKLTIYDITGAKVTTIVDRQLIAGEHSVNWDASSVASGIYYYSLMANDETLTLPMTLIK